MNRKKRYLLVVISLTTLFVLTVAPAFATFTVGFWKNRGLEQWDEPTDSLVTAGAPNCDGTGFWAGEIYPYQQGSSYTYLEILENRNAADASLMLAAQTIAAELNVALGACEAYGGNIQALTALANDFLMNYPVGSDPSGDNRDYAIALSECLDLHNNIEGTDPDFDYAATDAFACAVDILGSP